jgi:hypothetical protein
MSEMLSQRKRLPRRILLQKSYTRCGLYVQKDRRSQHQACKCLVAHTNSAHDMIGKGKKRTKRADKIVLCWLG